MGYEFRAKWSRFPDHKPPRGGCYLISRIGTLINFSSSRITKGVMVKYAYYDEKSHEFKDERSSDVIAWMPMPKPCEPLPDDYWHPDQIAARRYMGEEDE